MKFIGPLIVGILIALSVLLTFIAAALWIENNFMR